MNRPDAGSRFEELLTADRERIESRLGELLPPHDEKPVSLHEAMRYAVLGGGKRVRAALCLGAHRLFGNQNPPASLDAACSLELLHAYSLVHDDLPALDDDDTRRGKPSAHIRYGEAIALLAGDALQALAFEVLGGCPCPPRCAAEAVRLLARTAGSRHLVGGQVADLEGEGKRATEERVCFIHSRKTAELVACSLALGAITADVDERTSCAILSTGRKVGYAFQITDDLLDIGGREEFVGKELRKDEKKGKITHPACFGADESRRIARDLIEESIGEIAAIGDDGYLGWIFRMILDRTS